MSKINIIVHEVYLWLLSLQGSKFNNILSVLGTTVLVHGDAGTDATLQVTSLVQILLDPVCRTIKG